jgi:hypothetical protein
MWRTMIGTPWGRISHHIIQAIQLLNRADEKIDNSLYELLAEIRRRHHQRHLK